jgi:hypothetical protein
MPTSGVEHHGCSNNVDVERRCRRFDRTRDRRNGGLMEDRVHALRSFVDQIGIGDAASEQLNLAFKGRKVLFATGRKIVNDAHAFALLEKLVRDA